MNSVEVLRSPVKSEGDKKEYRLIRLSNGLKALLISKSDSDSLSKSEDISAACLAVNVGIFDDPKKAMGLAHFLEHILFMGSEKYPQENSFNDFLVANGGNDNAETSSEYTKFYFKISDKAFPKALDIFAHQFISPLLRKDAMQREREAVDSEFQMASTQTQLLIENVYKALINDAHPASQFDVGSLKTLKEDITDDDLHAELLKLYSKYVGGKMNLAVQSKRSLDELQELVVSTFSAVKSSNEEQSERTQMSVDQIFKPDFFEKIHFVKPKSAKKALHLSWALPSVQKHYKSSPLDYIAKIFSNESEGGIARYLMDRHWMTTLQCYTHVQGFGGNSHYCMPRLIIELTDLGYEKLDQVLAAIFSYLLMIKESPISEHRLLFNDIKHMRDTLYRFQKESSALKNVKDAVLAMTLHEDEDILQGISAFKEFDEQVIVDVITAMNQRKFNVLILNSEHQNYGKKEKYFGTEYDEQEFPESFKKLWDERKLNPEFFLETPNLLKPENFEIFTSEEESSIHPVKIFDDSVFEVWHKLDKTFNAPRATVHIYFLSPNQMTSIQSYLLLSIYDSMQNRRLKKLTAKAKSAGLKLSTKAERKALSFSFAGFNDKMEAFVEMVLRETKAFNDSMDESIFNLTKTQFKNHYRNHLLLKKVVADELYYEVLSKDFYTDVKLHEEIDRISFENLKMFAQKFFQNMKIQVLAQGNVTKVQALRLVATLQNYFPCEPLNGDFELLDRNYALPSGSNILRAKSLMPNDDSSYTNIFYQFLDVTLRTQSLCQLIVSILDPKAFHFLRNQEQLSYSVGIRYVKSVGILGFEVYVVSQDGKHSYGKVQSKIETFVNEVARKTIEDLTDEDFETFKDSRVKSLLVDFASAQDEANANWKEISQQEYVFDRFDLSAKVTKALTKRDLQEFFTSITQTNLRSICIAVIGTTKSDLKIDLVTDKLRDDEEVIADVGGFRSRLELQPALNFTIQ